MYDFFILNSSDIETTYNVCEEITKHVRHSMQEKVRGYFANEAVIRFDYNVLFNSNMSIYDNLMQSLSEAEEQIPLLKSMFSDISMMIMPTVMLDNHCVLFIFKNLPNEYHTLLSNLSLKKQEIDNGTDYIIKNKVKAKTYERVIFSLEFVNYAYEWTRFIPAFEERCSQLAEHIIFVKEFGDRPTTFAEKHQFFSQIRNTDKYKKVFNKISNVLPSKERILEDSLTFQEKEVVAPTPKATASKPKNDTF